MPQIPSSPAPPAHPLLTSKPWAVVGVSRSAWYALAGQWEAPPPVLLAGKRRPLYRVADLAAWVERLPTSRPEAAGGVVA